MTESDHQEFKKIKPSFLPPDLCTPSTSAKLEMKDAKQAHIQAYLSSCSEYTKTENTHANADRLSDEDELIGSWRPPKENQFWRDGETVMMNDGEDGLTTDYRVKLVFMSILKTIQCMSLYHKTLETKNRMLKDAFKTLEFDTRVLEAKKTKEKYYLQIISIVKNLILATDTSKGSRKLIVNQIHPFTCYVSDDVLNRLCRFNGFGSVNNYGYLECNFYITIKLIFLGSLTIKDFSEPSNTSYVIEPCHHFGTYFYECLEKIYEICFKKLEKEFCEYKTEKAFRDAQHEEAISRLKCGDMSSLMRLETTKSQTDDNVTLDGFLGGIKRLTRKENIRILGTSGKRSLETRLRYIGYDGEGTLSEYDPQTETDALFVSSFIRFRIQEDGGVQMDVYTRNAIQLEIVDLEHVI